MGSNRTQPGEKGACDCLYFIAPAIQLCHLLDSIEGRPLKCIIVGDDVVLLEACCSRISTQHACNLSLMVPQPAHALWILKCLLQLCLCSCLRRLEQQAAGIGFPLLIKAVSGGGGKGMKLAEDRQAFLVSALPLCREHLPCGL